MDFTWCFFPTRHECIIFITTIRRIIISHFLSPSILTAHGFNIVVVVFLPINFTLLTFFTIQQLFRE